MLLIRSIVTGLGILFALGLFAEPKFHRDPFMPYQLVDTNDQTTRDTPAVFTGKSLHLAGIIWDDQAPYAIFLVNGSRKIVSKGDHVFGHKIRAIYKDKVVVSTATKPLVMHVGKKVAL